MRDSDYEQEESELSDVKSPKNEGDEQERASQILAVPEWAAE